MVLCVEVLEDGTLAQVSAPHTQVHKHIGGPLKIVGAIQELGAVIVAARECVALPLNTHGLPPTCIEDAVRGKLVIAATDEHGSEMDLRLEELQAFLARDSSSTSDGASGGESAFRCG